MIDLCQWRARIGSWNCSRHLRQPSACTSTGNTYCGTDRASTGNTAQVKTPRLVLSIFCLLILLFISGDVELNPGPTLTDKPTKDELVELLSSSKFTAGTWEQFVCCLPNMTQDIITGIKERGSIEEDAMSAVAQRCFDNNPDITWSIIRTSLLNANEHILAQQILTDSNKKGTKVDATVTVETTLRKHFASLFYATEDCLESVTVEFFSKSLISRDVRKSPSFYKIANEFVALLFFCEEDMAELEENCRNFVHCLAKAGGPAKDAAIALAEDWEHEVLNKHNLKWSLIVGIETSTDLSIPSKISLSIDDEKPQELEYFFKEFLSLMLDIRKYYNKHYNVKDIAGFVTDYLEKRPTTELLTNCKDINSLFELVRPHYSFFDFDLLEYLAKQFPLKKDRKLELKFNSYVQKLQQFKNSTSIEQMKDAIKLVPLPHEASEVQCKIVIKLTGAWEKKTVENLKIIIEYLDAERARLVEIDEGSIVVTFLALSTSQSLIDKVQNKSQFIQYLGIFEIIINDEVIINREEDVKFTFEDSLLHVINHIDSDSEYERVALLLIELKINLNYQNTDGQTALMLASEGGHIEIFKSLLRNSANPFQLSANGRYIGLNYLACTALSQHIYKSIGGTKIIPRGDTSVEDMLEMAVKERGVSSHFYEPFTYVIENNLKEKFQWLQDCFCALNSSFLDAATNILSSKALVAETKQHFLSYIKKDATGEDAHQLVQLLQPHYSCLNINLLTKPCTITEPIKEQVEEYNTNLKMFKDTTSLLELAMMTKGMQYPDDDGCSKLILRLNKPWCSRTITDLNKMETFYLSPISSFITLQNVHCDASHSLTCTYLLPQLQIEVLAEAVIEQIIFLYKIGVFEAMIDDIPIMMEDEDKSFTFEAALQEAHQTNNEKLLLFLPEINISLPPDTDLIIASGIGQFMTVQFLLNKDPNINIQDNDGWTALMLASSNGHYQVVELLLSKDPDINIQNNEGVTALMDTSYNGHYEVVELLLSKDPDINIQNNEGVTALMFASENGHHQVVKLLLSKDPDINIQDNHGLTALMLASHNGHHQVVELLLSKDPDIDIQDDDGWTALMIASRYGHHQKITTLTNNERKLLAAAAEGDLGTLFSMIYEVGMSPGTPLVAGITPLMIAASCGHIELVEALIKAGADVNKRNDDGMNALDIVNDISFYDRSDIEDFLISNTPAGEPDPVSNNAESTNKKPNTVTAIKSIFGMFNSFMKKAYDPYHSKKKELKIPHGRTNTQFSSDKY
ncbi:PREDICTED: uncharacterized protein LOC109586591 [Amphimedon queenslandica]|uniref:Death domain-containing protein n=1 Tax=Amphimedon queenslandica TaxID=400682 RepID=A0AAN0JMX2_AMPQE|nr:PREDICTED: uncharacterized protein LOC109586591 [Amphimedon queenslandica]|eukprot:XP_019858348.1 PREDICTED: uncharacterized protein LOC109586591 [Amphimedon queenslandica]